jgi:hypothetical protein
MRIVKRIVLLMVIALLAVTLIGVPGAPAAEDRQSVVEQVIQRGVLRVGMSTFVPWAMKDKTGKLIGFRNRRGHASGRGHGVQDRIRPHQMVRHHSGPAHRKV